MNPKDKEIWDTYARNVAPMGKKTATKKPRKIIAAKPATEKTIARKMAQKETVSLKPSAVPVKQNPITLEHRREKKLRDGDVTIDGKIDLHGMTQAEAFDALAAFMRRAAKQGKRCLLVITGKGKLGGGVLRNNLHGWLQQLPEARAILTVRSASIKHGGTGAFYILMRKQ